MQLQCWIHWVQNHSTQVTQVGPHYHEILQVVRFFRVGKVFRMEIFVGDRRRMGEVMHEANYGVFDNFLHTNFNYFPYFFCFSANGHVTVVSCDRAGASEFLR